MTEIFGHRGASGYAPENTIHAFELAAAQGADGVELDVQLTKDGTAVVVHDETIDRVSDGKGPVRDYTFAELREFSFHNHMDSYRGVKIPALREVLELAEAAGIKVNIELKTGIFPYPGIEKTVLELVEECGMSSRVIYSSFNHYSVQTIRRLDPRAETAYLFSDVILDVEQYAADTGVPGLHPAVYHMKMGDFYERYRMAGRKVRVWTVDEEEDMRTFLKWKTDAIITNFPDKAIEIRRKIKMQ